MKATFAGNPETTIIIVYAPTEEKSETIKDLFYTDLLKCTNEVAPHNLLILAGDFNARIGADSSITSPVAIGKHTFHQITNKNGNKLVEFCEAANVRSTQSRFPHPKSGLWTWQHSKNRNKDHENRAQLDHILINGKWLNSVKNVRAYNSVEVGSDHRILSARIKISFRSQIAKKCKRIKFDWNKLERSNLLLMKFNIEVRNQFNLLQDESDDIQLEYDHFEKSIEVSALKVVGKLPSKVKKNWVTTKTLELLKQRNSAKKEFIRTRKAEPKEQWLQLKEKLKKSYENDEINFLEDKLCLLKQAAASQRLRTTWQLVNEISGKKGANKQRKMKRADGTKINSAEELLKEWQKYFDKLLNVNARSEDNSAIPQAKKDLKINIGQLTIDETRVAVQELKSGKSPGLDYAVTPEALKYGGEAVIERLCQICNKVYLKEKAPKQFTTALIVPLPKKGDLSQMNNYRASA